MAATADPILPALIILLFGVLFGVADTTLANAAARILLLPITGRVGPFDWGSGKSEKNQRTVAQFLDTGFGWLYGNPSVL